MGKGDTEHGEHDEGDEEEEPHISYKFEKCHGSSADNAIVAVSRYHLANSYEGKTENLLDRIEICTVLFLFWLVLGIQMCLICMFYKYWVEVKDDPYEETYYKLMKAALLNSTVFERPLSQTGTLASSFASMHCQLNRATPIMHMTVLWIWFGHALGLTCKALWRFVVVWSFDEDDHSPASHVKDEKLDPPPGERDVKITVQYMNLHQKLFSTVFILVPSLLLQIAVAWVGASYISVQTEIGMLVKSSLKMGFIAKMDKYIFNSYVSSNWECYIESANYKIVDYFENYDGFNIMDSWVASVTKISLGFVATWYCCFQVWPQIEEYRQMCEMYFHLFPAENVLPGRIAVPVANISDHWFYPKIR